MDKDPTHFTKGGVIKPTILPALKAVAFRGPCMSRALAPFLYCVGVVGLPKADVSA